MNGLTTRSTAYQRASQNETLAEWFARTEANAARLEATTHYVYRVFDEYDLLLYIGCTVNLGSRMGAHRGRAPWYRYLDFLEIESYPTRSAARAAEADAIETEGSYFNAKRGDNVPPQSSYLAARAAREQVAS